jgi:hypothetical protein
MRMNPQVPDRLDLREQQDLDPDSSLLLERLGLD